MTNKPSTAQTSREGLSDKEVENLPTLEKTLFKTFGTFVTVSMLLICVMYVSSSYFRQCKAPGKAILTHGS